MTKYNRKIKAFTIMELLVTMVITSIIVGLASTMYLNMQHYFTTSEQGYEKNSDVNFVVSLLKTDFDNAATAVSSFGLVTLIGNDNKMLEYDFGDGYITRKVDYRRDTFYVTTENLDVIRLNDNTDLVTEINADVLIDGEAVPLHIYKSYTRDVLFNLYHTGP